MEKNELKYYYKIGINKQKVVIAFSQDSTKNFVINRQNMQRQFVNEDQFQSIKFENVIKVSGIYGLLQIQQNYYLCYYKNIRQACQIQSHIIYQIEKLLFLKINNKQKIHLNQLENICKITENLFYFSYTYQVQNLYQIEKNEFNVKSLKFFWNYNSLLQLIDQSEIKFDFFKPIIQGFVQFIKISDINIVFIARRSFQQGGTRLISRGVNFEGYCANFVEIEQIVENIDTISSFVQVRGSIPLFWSQKTIIPQFEFHQNSIVNQNIMRKHIQDLKDYYCLDQIQIINLLGEKWDEPKLTEIFFKIFYQIQPQFNFKATLENLDFHQITKQPDFSGINVFMEKIFDKTNFNIFKIDSNTIKQTQKQKILIRSNCLDCLDRTNVYQFKTSFLYLSEQLKTAQYFGFEFQNVVDSLEFLEVCSLDEIQKFKILWSELGDQISKIYAGSGSTTTHATIKGKNSFISNFMNHKAKSINRIFLSITDIEKQKSIKVLLQQKHFPMRISTNEQKKLININIRFFQNLYEFQQIQSELNSDIQIIFFEQIVQKQQIKQSIQQDCSIIYHQNIVVNLKKQILNTVYYIDKKQIGNNKIMVLHINNVSYAILYNLEDYDFKELQKEYTYDIIITKNQNDHLCEDEYKKLCIEGQNQNIYIYTLKRSIENSQIQSQNFSFKLQFIN